MWFYKINAFDSVSIAWYPNGDVLRLVLHYESTQRNTHTHTHTHTHTDDKRKNRNETKQK